MFWKNAGITYLRYSQIAASVTRACIKRGKEAVKPEGTLKVTKWESGKPIKNQPEK